MIIKTNLSWVSQLIGFNVVGMAILPFIFLDQNYVSRIPMYVRNVLINHENIHIHQQLQCLVVGMVFFTGLYFALDVSPWWILPSSYSLFYALYVLHFLYKLIQYRSVKIAYENICFEVEAKKFEWNDTYTDYIKWFYWLKYL